MNVVDTWGVCYCFEGRDDEWVDEDIRKDFFSLQPNGKVFHCIAQREEMLTLAYGENIFLVNSRLYKVVKEPLYKVGDVVMTEKLLVGQIVDVCWHIKGGKPFYFIQVHGTRRSKRYWDYDLRKMEECLPMEGER